LRQTRKFADIQFSLFGLFPGLLPLYFVSPKHPARYPASRGHCVADASLDVPQPLRSFLAPSLGRGLHPCIFINHPMRTIYRHLGRLKRDNGTAFRTTRPPFRCHPGNCEDTGLGFRLHDEDRKIHARQARIEEWCTSSPDYGRWIRCALLAPDTVQSALTLPFLPLCLLPGRATGGVSLIQTVGDSSDASCLPTDLSPMSSFFTFNPPVLSQCFSETVSWNSTRYPEPPDIRGFIPGGRAFGLDRPTSNSSTQQGWDVNIRDGTQVVFLALPVASDQNTSNARTSPLITITGKSSQGDACLNADSPSSTLLLDSIVSSSTILLASTAVAASTAPTASTASASFTVLPNTPNLSGNVKCVDLLFSIH